MSADPFLPKRGRPSAKQVAAIDEAILATARRIFLADGYDALAMDAVASELGVSKGTLYSRHPSKEALLHAVLKDTIARWSTVSAASDHLLPADLKPRLKAHLEAIGRRMNAPDVKAYRDLWSTVQHRVPDVSRLFYEIGFMKGVEVIAGDLRAAGEREGMPPRDPEGTASLLLSTMTGWYLQESTVRDVTAEEIDAVAERTVDIFYLARSAW